MKALVLVVLGLVAALVGCGSAGPAPRASSAPAEHKGPLPTHQEILAVMDAYLMYPFNGHPEYLDQILDFVTRSHDVTVVLDPAVLPFVDEGLDPGVENLLSIAFAAGNAASQLRAKVKRDDPLAGVEGELALYLILKAHSTTSLKDRKVVSSHLDTWLELRSRGELRAHLERARGARLPDELSPRPLGASAPAHAAPPSENGSDDALWDQVQEAMRLIQAGRPQDAIATADKVIAASRAQYADEKRHVYCSHGQAETLKYMLDAANRQEEAVAIGPTWAEALYVKSFALTELHRGGEALAALEAALSLAPSFSRYLAERGYMYQKAKDWRRALQKYEEAEGSVKLLTDRQAQVTERTRALRGQGYALVELGEIDAAERKYKQSLAIDPDDATSKKELDYIQGLRANRH